MHDIWIYSSNNDKNINDNDTVQAEVDRNQRDLEDLEVEESIKNIRRGRSFVARFSSSFRKAVTGTVSSGISSKGKRKV